MKQFLLLMVFIAPIAGLGQTTPQKLMDSILKRTKEISFYSNEVHWDSLELVVTEMAKDATTTEELAPACESLMNGICDHHGRLKKLSDYSNFAHFSDYDNARFQDTREFKNENWSIVNDLNARFTSEVLADSIGYLRVVGVGPIDGQKESERIRSEILTLYAKGINNWVLDLRYNSGGNINVMLAGLAPLLDSGTVATTRNANQEVQGTARISVGNFYYYEVCAFPIEDSTKIKNPKIAVLTSRWTASSGELTAIAFKKQKNTKFYGEPTGGYTTNTSWELFNDELALVIATAVFSDRDGEVYPENILPDVMIPFEVNESKEQDEAVQKAINWLQR